MKKVKTIIKFDGPALTGKSMDVAELAPSLIALSDIFQFANKAFNGDKSAIKVLVNADVEQNCFELTLQIAQTIWEQVNALIADDNIKTVKEIAEWVGIISAGTGFTLFKLIKKLKNKKVTGTLIIKQENGNIAFQITVEGDNNKIIVEPEVYQLYTNREIRRRAVAVLQPLKAEGYDSLEFYEGKNIFERFTPDDVPESFEYDLPDIRPSNEQVSTIRTNVRIRKPAYEGRSKWTLVYLKAIEAAIDDTQWLDDFQANKISAPPNSSLDVDLEQRVIINDRGEAIEDPIYKVLKVYGVILPSRQISLFGDASDDSN